MAEKRINIGERFDFPSFQELDDVRVKNPVRTEELFLVAKYKSNPTGKVRSLLTPIPPRRWWNLLNMDRGQFGTFGGREFRESVKVLIAPLRK